MNDEKDRIDAFARKAMADLDVFLESSMVEPWLYRRRDQALAAKVLSASPTRGGQKVQARIRLSPDTLVCLTVGRRSMHDFDKQARTRTLKPRLALVDLFRTHTFSTVFRVDDFEASLRLSASNALSSKIIKEFPQTAARSFGRNGSVEIARDIVRHWVSGLDLHGRINAIAEVPAAVHAVAEKALDAVLAVPEEAYSGCLSKSQYESARSKLTRAMEKAMKAGLSDEDIESVRLTAIAKHVMDS